MEWEDYPCVTVIGLHKVDKSASQIFTLLQTLKISERIVYNTIEPFRDSGNVVVDRVRSKLSRSVQTKWVVEAIHSQINRSSIRKQKIVAQVMKIN